MSSAPSRELAQWTPQESTAHPVVPDLEYIRRRIPIQNVARALGISVNGRQAHCWRIAAHNHGDSSPSIWFNRSNRGHCEVCDSRPWSTIDLVMLYHGIGINDAIVWIASHFHVPDIPKGRHLQPKRRWQPTFRVGTGDLMENIVRSGLLADFSGAEAKVLDVLVTFADKHTRVVTISYAGIAQYAGVASYSTVSKALRRFKKLHLLEIHPRVNGGFRECSSYQLTPDDPQFLAIARERNDKTLELVREQRAMREAVRTKRRSDVTGHGTARQ